jgi:hypothetical protein
MRIKLLGTAVNLTTTPNVVNPKATDLLIVHDAGGNTTRLVTLYEADGTTVVGSYFTTPGTSLVLHKKANQKLAVDTGTDVHASPVAYIS